MGLKIIDHSEEAMRQIEQAIRRGLEKCGQKAEGYAKMKCPVDTGLLRNSITHVVDGSALDYYYRADTGTASGEYHFNAPKKDEPTVTIGSNVEYAPYVEMGHIKKKKKTEKEKTEKEKTENYVPPKRFLELAATQHTAEYKGFIEKELAKLG